MLVCYVDYLKSKVLFPMFKIGAISLDLVAILLWGWVMCQRGDTCLQFALKSNSVLHAFCGSTHHFHSLSRPTVSVSEKPVAHVSLQHCAILRYWSSSFVVSGILASVRDHIDWYQSCLWPGWPLWENVKSSLTFCGPSDLNDVCQ